VSDVRTVDMSQVDVFIVSRRT